MKSILFLFSFFFMLGGAQASQLHLAVASNFIVPAKQLAAQFELQTSHKVILSSASSGKLYAQISHGLPVDILLSADQKIPRKLMDTQLAVQNSRFTYAQGRLVLWSGDAGLVKNSHGALAKGQFSRFAIANPDLAPYGLAAKQTLEHLGLYQSLIPKLVKGENINQCFQYVVSGNAQLGLISLSQYQQLKGKGSAYIIPAQWHQAILQDAVLLKRAEHNAAALGFMQFLKSDAAKLIIKASGYQISHKAPPVLKEDYIDVK